MPSKSEKPVIVEITGFFMVGVRRFELRASWSRKWARPALAEAHEISKNRGSLATPHFRVSRDTAPDGLTGRKKNGPPEDNRVNKDNLEIIQSSASASSKTAQMSSIRSSGAAFCRLV